MGGEVARRTCRGGVGVVKNLGCQVQQGIMAGHRQGSRQRERKKTMEESEREPEDGVNIGGISMNTVSNQP
eukprot:758480-Hanusia_phi.AAC.4